MSVERWNDPASNGLALLLTHGNERVFVAMNEGSSPQSFVVPEPPPGTDRSSWSQWSVALASDDATILHGDVLRVDGRTVAVLRSCAPSAPPRA
jgi:pullulanase/glycogen debranching enzyme